MPEAQNYVLEKQPGAVVVEKGSIELNKGRKRYKLKVTNRGDRPIQVYHPVLKSNSAGWFTLSFY